MSFLLDNCSFDEITSSDMVAGFSCGDSELDAFFAADCLLYSTQLLGKTYGYYSDSNKELVCAFTLANAGLRVGDLPNARRKKIETDIPHIKSLKDYPAVLVARLGVSAKYKLKHIGSETLDFIKGWFTEPANKTGCRFVLVDAYNNTRTIAFYQKNGFRLVFSSDKQEGDYRHIDNEDAITTRLMYYDLTWLNPRKDNQ